jgi:hypothetical protein
MMLKKAFYRNIAFIEALPKHFCLQMSPFVSGWRRQCHLVLNWLQMSRFEASSVVPAGVEPTTDRLEICCSIQLSYGTNINASRGRQIRTADLHVPNVAR